MKLFIMKTKYLISVFILAIICVYVFAQVGDRCTTTTGGSGTCKISYDCPLVEEQAKNGVRPTICGFHQLTTPIVCCESNNNNNNNNNNYNNNNNNNNNNRPQANENTFLNVEQNTPDTFIYPDSETQNNNGLSISDQKCAEYSKTVTSIVQALPLVPNSEPVSIKVEKCDYNGVPLIVGGSPAAAGEFPFMAVIGFTTEENEVEWRCGGTLISDYYVVTAAHCTTSRDAGAPKIIRLGDLDLSRNDDGSQYEDYNIARIIQHPNYRYPKKYNDIALMLLSKKVRFNKFIRPACLYNRNTIEQTKAVATGWGKTDYLAVDTSKKLLKVALNIFDNNHCSRVYHQNKNLPDGIKPTMLCAGELKGGRDTCQGDSGGPLIITKKGNQCKFYIIGVTSFGKYCGAANTPAIYTRVSEYVSWIESTIWQ